MPRASLGEVLTEEDITLRRLVLLLADQSLAIAGELPKTLGETSRFNVYGEKQEEIDVWSNSLLTKKLAKSRLVKEIATEEIEQPLEMKHGEYSVTPDPLDGSSNIKSDNLMGTIVGVYRGARLPAKGRDLTVAMYFLYGPYTQALIALSRGVYIFVANKKIGASRAYLSDGMTHKLPDKGTVYGIGGLKEKWTPKVQNFVQSLERKGLKLRYGGSFVGDFNQVLYYGGIFAYPELVDSPNGKLRLQFESNPIAFIAEKAGGKGSTGARSILDVEPKKIDERVPTYVGNADLVKEIENPTLA